MLTTTTQTTKQSALMMMPIVAAQRYGARRLRARIPHTMLVMTSTTPTGQLM